MKNKYIIAILLLCSTFNSCAKFLDINPKAEVVDKDMFSTEQGCEDAVMGLYGELKSINLYGERWNWGVFDVLSQDLNAGEETYQYLKSYNYNDARKMIDTLWIESYKVVGYANNIIGNLEERTENRFSLQDLYLGEAYGVRAMLHFDLVRAFAPHVELKGGERGIPYVTKYTFKHTDFSTVNQVYDYIVADLRKAQEYLKMDESVIVYPRVKLEDEMEDLTTIAFLKGRQMHFNYYAATALLARVLWTKGEYADARTEALKVINSGKFPLANKDEITLLIAGVLSPKETIWGIYSTDYVNITKKRFYTNQSWEVNLPYSSNKTQYPYQKIYSQYLETNSGSDSRLNWFRASDGGGNTIECLKVVDEKMIKESTDTPTSRGYLDGISVLKVSELYYIVAEAFLRENSVSEATDYINKVLMSRGLTELGSRMPVIVPSLDMLYNERHKEMYCEGQRWFDMKKRNENILSNNTKVTHNASDLIYVLPIPLIETDNRN